MNGSEDIGSTGSAALSSQKRRRRDPILPELVPSAFCCRTAQCVKHFPASVVADLRAAFSGKDRHQKLLDYLTDHQSITNTSDYSLLLRNILVCADAFCIITNIPRTTFYRIKKCHDEAGERTASHGNMGTVHDTTKKNGVLAFLHAYIEQITEAMPNTDTVNLPTCTTVLDLYELYKSVERDEAVTRQYFVKLFEIHFPHVKAPPENRFSRCNHCAKIKDTEKQLKIGDYLGRAQLNAHRKQHLNEHLKQRYDFERQITDAKQYPSLQCTVMLDGMDQNKTNIPYSRFNYSVLSSVQKLQFHVLGALTFGQSLYFYLDVMEYPHGSNLNLTALLMTLTTLDPLPPKLHVQLDNTCRENKNQFVFGFLSHLIESRIFDQITVGFLMKGHTHAQIDQTFSRLSTHINGLKRGLLTPQQFQTAAANCCQSEGRSKPVPIRIERVYAISEWLTPHLDKFGNLQPHHNFELTLGEDSNCRLRFKEWAWSEWREAEFVPLKTKPTGRPLLLKPNYEKTELAKVQHGVGQLLSVGGITHAEQTEWADFFQAENATQQWWQHLPDHILPVADGGNPKIVYAVDESPWLLDQLMAKAASRRLEPEPQLHPALQKAREEMEQPAPPVMPIRERAKWKRQREVEAATPAADIREGTIVLVIPDMEQCVALGKDPARYPWLASAAGTVSADGTFPVRWYESNKMAKFHLTRNTDTLHTASVLLWDVRLLANGKLSDTCEAEARVAMESYHDEYERLCDDDDIALSALCATSSSSPS